MVNMTKKEPFQKCFGSRNIIALSPSLMNGGSELERTPGNISLLVSKVASLKLLMNCVLKKEKSICGE